MKKVIALLCAFVIACVLVRGSSAAPEVSPWGYTSKVIWPIGGVASAADTLGRFASDSVATTDSINVFGARYVALLVSSTGAAGSGAFNGGTGTAYDTLLAPVLVVRLPTGQWSGIGAGAMIPYSGGNPLLCLATNKPVDNTGKIWWTIDNQTTIASSASVPFTNDYFRWRIKTNNVRACQSGVNPACVYAPSSGRITVTVCVWR